MMGFYYARQRESSENEIPIKFPLADYVQTPSQKATVKYFWIVSALFLVQVVAGIITAHYTVEGQAFFGFPLSQWLPYSVSRTWHIQIAIFWIATSWLATGLYYAPAISGVEPKYQKLGVNVLFLALLVIVVGSLAGQWMGIMQKLGYIQNFWFGHQGYEYVDLGRFWQIFLFLGLFIWLFLMGRAIWPALKVKSESRNLLILFLISSIAIAAFYGAGLMWGRQTNLAVAEYWRWWVVHLWVEGFFEVFAAVVMVFLFVRMQIVKAATATTAVLFSTIVFLSGGIFGFLINPPIALYYMQGLNTTAVHGHAALFGVYGMLGIGLMLFVLRDMDKDSVWNEKWLKFAFWSINIGLTAMILFSLLPVGLAQTLASVKEGLWYARSAEFMQQPFILTFKWLRMTGDTMFAFGTIALAWFIFGLKTGWSLKKL